MGASEFLRLLDTHLPATIYIRQVSPPRIIFINRAYEHTWGRLRSEVLNDYSAWIEAIHPDDRERIRKEMTRIWETGEAHDLEFRIVRPDGAVRWLRNQTRIGKVGESFAIGIAEDVTEAHLTRSSLAAQHEVLQSIAGGARLQETLELCCRAYSRVFRGVRASVLLLGPDRRVIQIVAPSFSDTYGEAVKGFSVDRPIGTCGAAMYFGHLVVSSDLTSDPAWAELQRLVQEHQLVACWSTPIRASSGEIYGSFGLYPTEKRAPNEMELDLLESMAHLAAIAVERDRDEQALRDANALLEERVRERTFQLEQANKQLESEAAERRAALAALEESEERFRSIVQSVPGAVYRCLLDSNWTMHFLSDGSETLTGYPAESFLRPDGKKWAEIIHPDDRDAIERAIEEAASARRPFSVEYRIRHRDGSIRWMFEQGRAVFHGDEVLYLDGVILDATTEHHMQEAIRESEQRFRVLADEAPMLVWMTDAEGRCEFCNRGWTEFTGRSSEMEYGDGWLQSILPEHHARLRDCITQGSCEPFQLECAMRRADGEVRTMFMRGAPRGGANRAFGATGFIGSAIDIADLRKAQDEARRQEAELAHALRLATVGEMASTIAHELNQPLTSISNYATGAMRRIKGGGISADELAQVLHEIDTLARNGGEIIQHVRSLVQRRVQRGGEVRLAWTIERAWKMLETDALEAGVTMEMELTPLTKPVLVDAVQFEQVLVNIFRNAVEELREAPQDRRFIRVTTRREPDGGLVLDIADTGRGMPKGQPPTFAPFHSTKPHGMGLGLAISRSIIESHGGKLSYLPNEPTGAIFRIELPPPDRQEQAAGRGDGRGDS